MVVVGGVDGDGNWCGWCGGCGVGKMILVVLVLFFVLLSFNLVLFAVTFIIIIIALKTITIIADSSHH